MPKFRWGFTTTVRNRKDMKITSKWYGISWGRFFFGSIVALDI